MIIGIGTDLIEIARIKKACEKEAFLVRYFTKNEIELFQNNHTKAAGNFAVKEAVSKVIGTGFLDFSPIDIEVLRDDLGKPYVNLYGMARGRARQLKIHKIFVSISNTKEHVVAVAIGEGNSDEIFSK